MQQKHVFLLFLVITVLVAAGVFLILHDTGGNDPVSVEAETPQTTRDKTQVVQTPADEGLKKAEKEIIAPDDDIPQEPMEEMPASFSESLGGITGRVVEEDVTPVQGIKVEILGIDTGDLVPGIEAIMADAPLLLKPKVAHDKTGEDGRFRLTGVFPRAFYLLFVDPGGERPLGRILDLYPGPGETVDIGDVVLPAHAVIIGKVVDEDGNPVHGARVRATDLPPIVYLSGIQDYRKGCSFLVMGGFIGNTVFEPLPALDSAYKKLPIPTTMSGKDGSFSLKGAPPGRAAVIVDHPDYVTATHGPITTVKSRENDIGRVELSRGMTAKGKVLDQKGNRLPGVEVRLGSVRSIKEFVVLKPSLTTDEKGGFSQPGIATLSAMAAARRHPKDQWTLEGPFNPATGSVLITLPPAYDLEVLPMTEDGSMITDAQLKIRPRERLIEDFLFLNPPITPGERMERNEDGAITINDLPPGKYELLVTAPGFATEREKITLKDGPIERKVLLTPACSARVKVLVGDTDEPVEWADVQACTDDDDWIQNPARVSRGRTDSNGRVLLKKLGSGKYMVSAMHPRYGLALEHVEMPTDTETVIRLEPGGTLEGVVYPGTSGREPPYMLILTTRSWDGTEVLMPPRITVTNMEGEFRVANLTPGSWRIEVNRRVFDKGVAGLMEIDNMRALERGKAEIKSGETSFVEIVIGKEEPMVCSSVSGDVFINGQPAEGGKLMIWAQKRYEAKLDAGGSYIFEKVPVGSHTLNLTEVTLGGKKQNISLYREINVMKNIPLYENFDIMTGSVSGRIEDSGGSPVDGTFSILISSENDDAPYRVRKWAQTDPKGNFALEYIPVGIYTIKTFDGSLVCEDVKGIRVLPGRDAGPVVLTRVSLAPVEGRVALSTEMEGADKLRLYFAPLAGGGGGMIDLSISTGEFVTENIAPGSYMVMLYVDWNMKHKPINVEIPEGGATGLYFVFEEK